MSEARRHRRTLTGKIEMTPLMDLTFTLLIVFIITVPILDYSTDVTPPKMTTSEQVETVNDSAVVTIDAEGRCQLDGMEVAFAELDAAFVRLRDTQGKNKIMLRGDKTRPYDDIITVMRAAKHAGMEISLMTQAE